MQYLVTAVLATAIGLGAAVAYSYNVMDTFMPDTISLSITLLEARIEEGSLLKTSGVVPGGTRLVVSGSYLNTGDTIIESITIQDLQGDGFSLWQDGSIGATHGNMRVSAEDHGGTPMELPWAAQGATPADWGGPANSYNFVQGSLTAASVGIDGISTSSANTVGVGPGEVGLFRVTLYGVDSDMGLYPGGGVIDAFEVAPHASQVFLVLRATDFVDSAVTDERGTRVIRR